ncbi:hypothetical protein Hanom_Chr07g00593661 [Helianthus anomalus]
MLLSHTLSNLDSLSRSPKMVPCVSDVGRYFPAALKKMQCSSLDYLIRNVNDLSAFYFG